uniref:Uncharacterized protein n=1 Tax=Arundo donax TaxID=35708 RepID=A0A0A9A273_ARUDO
MICRQNHMKSETATSIEKLKEKKERSETFKLLHLTTN